LDMEDYVKNMFVDNNNTLWLASQYSGILRSEGDGVTAWNDGLGFLDIRNTKLITQDRDNTFWAATWCEVFKLIGSTWMNFTLIDVLGVTWIAKLRESTGIREIMFDRNNSLWINYDCFILKWMQQIETGVSALNITHPSAFNISNSPNPFNPSTTISFFLPHAGRISLAIHDITGRTVAEPLRGFYPAGTHSVVWNAHDRASGVYFCTLKAGQGIMTRKMLLVR
ncbi:MAG: T9SS type A sorting domain-containing protein, partial [Candidatus Latescibacterota bacterium]